MNRLLGLALSLLLAVPTWAQRVYHGDGPDDALRFVPVVAAYALKVCGMESESSWKRLAVNTTMSYAFSVGTTWALKHSIHERRPDWTDNRSFPWRQAWPSIGWHATAMPGKMSQQEQPSVWAARSLAIGSVTRLQESTAATH